MAGNKGFIPPYVLQNVAHSGAADITTRDAAAGTLRTQEKIAAGATSTPEVSKSEVISITPLLKRLWPSPSNQSVSASEIAFALSHIFTNSLSPVQTGALLTALHFTGEDRKPAVLSACAAEMRGASTVPDATLLRECVAKNGAKLKRGGYRGGLCDIVGTGGDSHNTYNVSTTSSIIASAYLLLAKHGNRASTSASGSADLLTSPVARPRPAVLTATTPSTITAVYEKTNYAFLFAPVFHPGMAYVAPVRKELGWRTIFNLLGPLSNPIESTGTLEARMIGVARRDVGPAFAEALALGGATKALVVCGDEELDEISCAGLTHCWAVQPIADDEVADGDDEERQRTTTTYFALQPSDFGLPAHPLSEVHPGGTPTQNAEILMNFLDGKIADDDPVLHFVLMNTAALLVIAGVCDEDEAETIKETGPGGFRWKEGVRLARLAIKDGRAKEMWAAFANVTNELSGQ
ncbi:hypothetical protein P152DRAFT_426676 [Eremomyces bilateralis CBS 781.70]|uniref:Anthranilate phosphoribosyltransferase n=1 Tax=Eremomyces bilateralis CBS 781.70 TaxID=1392243 RepID=A0A6G1GGV8_9PEZI|nr:uncharacterized protein P152DRAFT_426676 [Eremomyces bilateralis CBS 781.70]KAF1817100.1 hypothetical protein P152DRAFT_426676 [Eremomyces bilateralis CBS 781.70]